MELGLVPFIFLLDALRFSESCWDSDSSTESAIQQKQYARNNETLLCLQLLSEIDSLETFDVRLWRMRSEEKAAEQRGEKEGEREG